MTEIRPPDETEDIEGSKGEDATTTPQTLGALGDHAKKIARETKQGNDTKTDDNAETQVRGIPDNKPNSNYQFEGPALLKTHDKNNPEWTTALNTENGAETALEKCAAKEVPLGNTKEQFARAEDGLREIGDDFKKDGIDVDIRLRGSAAEGFSGNPTKDANPENIADTWLTEDFPKALEAFEELGLDQERIMEVLEPAKGDVVNHIAQQFETFRDNNGQLPVGRPFDSELHASDGVGDVILDNKEVQQKLKEYVEGDPALAEKLQEKHGLDSPTTSSDLADRLSDDLRTSDAFKRPPSDIDVQVSSNEPFKQLMDAVLSEKDSDLTPQEEEVRELAPQEREVLKDQYESFKEALEVLGNENSDDSERRTAWNTIEDGSKSLLDAGLFEYSPFNQYGGLNKVLLKKFDAEIPLITKILALCEEWKEEIGRRDVNPMFMPAGGPPPYDYAKPDRDKENISVNKPSDWIIFPRVSQ